MRYELNKLSTMKHAFVVRFVGVLTNPLCFVLEWAPGKSLEHTRMAHVEANSSICPTALFLVLLQVSPECCIHISICITCTVMGTMRLSDKVSALAITVESETIHTTFCMDKIIHHKYNVHVYMVHVRGFGSDIRVYYLSMHALHIIHMYTGDRCPHLPPRSSQDNSQ